MAHRDHLFKARRLATSTATDPPPPLTFFGGNETYRLEFGYLYYANVLVGTPGVLFLVALDTGSDLFWLPCDCPTCGRSWNSTSGKNWDLEIYSPSKSRTSTPVPCNSTICGPRRGCSVRHNACAYQEVYLSRNTSSTGILVDDVLRLGTDANPQNLVDASVTLGCGMIQTGDYVDSIAINGLFGLGMGNVSVPSILASKGLASNSFSMCFGTDGQGRILFGDKGSPNQKVTPFNLQQSPTTYNITVTQIAVGNNFTDLQFTAIFDSGTSYTYLNDPAYSFIVESFNSQIKDIRYYPQKKIVFDYCYEFNATQGTYVHNIPNLNFTMKGGSQYYVNAPAVMFYRKDGDGKVYCLGIVKTEDINIIGQMFMMGNRIVFDREELVLGWQESDCYNDSKSKNKSNSTNAPPPSILSPEATPANRTRTPVSSARSNSMTTGLMIVMLAVFSHHFVILSI